MNFIIISSLVKKKEKAFEKGTNEIAKIKSSLEEVSQKLDIYNQTDKYIGLNPFDVSRFIYDNPKFYDYLKYSFIGKHYDKIINIIIRAIILLFIFVVIGLYFIFKFGPVFIISCVILIILLLIILKFINTGESYKSYYNRTFYSLILNSYKNISFIFNPKSLPADEVKEIVPKKFTDLKSSDNLDFTSNIANGNITNLIVENKIETADKNGNTRTSTSTVLDGFYIQILLNKNYNKLRGNIIKITDDETIFSSITEDTAKGIYESNREFNFNSEEMNKSFDCKVSGYTNFNSIDEMMHEVTKIITPSFEQHMLYLRERYNSFNMNISDTSLILSFNMVRSTFQKLKHNELLTFTKTYRDDNKKVRNLSTSLSGYEEFAYYNVFPFMEKLYLVNYLTYLYLSYIDFENYYDVNSNAINSFEEQMKNVYKMESKEFRKIYLDKLQQVYKNTKNYLKEKVED